MLNRLESDKYPDDLMDAVREKAQFSAYYDKKTETYPYIDRNPSQDNGIQAVDDALAWQNTLSAIICLGFLRRLLRIKS